MARRKVTGGRPIKGSLNFDAGIAKNVISTEIKDFVPETYLPYAASTILDRALPGEDGLIPVQRRILWALYVNHHTPSSAYAKVASLQGEVMKYHPHGDQSIVQSIVRMGQPYSLRTTFIDPHGSFAKIPGDKAAAPRYISGRLTKAAMDSLEELKWNGVEMGTNYDGELPEPPLIPVRFPVSIVNGAQGIATGFATLMPQHNPTEAMKVARYMLKHPNPSIDSIMRIMPGPDFETGGVVMGTSGIRDYYETGSGSMTIRARYEIEPEAGGRSTIVFTEFPPMVCISTKNKSGVQDKILEIFESENWKDAKGKDAKTKKKKYETYAPARKALEGIERVVDQTDFDTVGVRFEVEVKQGYNARAIATALYKYTDLESKFPVNNTVIYQGRPKQASIKELFTQFLDFRRSCVLNVSKSKKQTNDKRIEQIKGLLIVILDIDKAIRIIRSSTDDKIAHDKLVKGFKISDEQAEYILSMPLRRLTKQNKLALQNEQKELENANKDLTAIITDRHALDAEVDRLLVETMKIIGTERRMEILDKTDEELAQMDRDARKAIRDADKDIPCMLSVKPDGKVIRTKESYNRPMRYTMKASTQGKILIIGSDGKGYAVPASYFNEDAPVSIESTASMPDGVKAVGFTAMGTPMVTVSSDGQVKITTAEFNDKWTEHDYHGLKGNARIVQAIPVPEFRKMDTPELILITRTGKAIRFDYNEIRPTGFAATGVAGMKLAKGDEIIDAMLSVKPKEDVVLTVSKASMKRTAVSDIPKQKRAGAGIILHTLAHGDSIMDAMLNGNVISGRSTKPVQLNVSKRASRLNAPLPPSHKIVMPA